MTFTPNGQLLVADVGQDTWEEVDLVTAGANYGWPNAEGPCNGIGDIQLFNTFLVYQPELCLQP